MVYAAVREVEINGKTYQAKGALTSKEQHMAILLGAKYEELSNAALPDLTDMAAFEQRATDMHTALASAIRLWLVDEVPLEEINEWGASEMIKAAQTLAEDETIDPKASSANGAHATSKASTKKVKST